MTHSVEQPRIYISALELENVRCFGRRQTLFLTDQDGNPVQWTLILGDNGVGKTTLLQCLAWMRPDRSDDEKRERASLVPALSGEENSTLKSLIRIGPDVKARLSATFSVCQSICSQEGEASKINVT